MRQDAGYPLILYQSGVSGGRNYDLVWTLMKSEMAAATFFAFLPTARDDVPNVVKFNVDLRLMTQPGSVLVPLPHQGCKGTKEIKVFSVYR